MRKSITVISIILILLLSMSAIAANGNGKGLDKKLSTDDFQNITDTLAVMFSALVLIGVQVIPVLIA